MADEAAAPPRRRRRGSTFLGTQQQQQRTQQQQPQQQPPSSSSSSAAPVAASAVRLQSRAVMAEAGAVLTSSLLNVALGDGGAVAAQLTARPRQLSAEELVSLDIGQAMARLNAATAELHEPLRSVLLAGSLPAGPVEALQTALAGA